MLDSGTLTPLVKRLVGLGLVERKRAREDEREVRVSLTSLGRDLREKAMLIPEKMGSRISISDEILTRMRDDLNEIFERLATCKGEPSP
jgi:DNA-binding MarR family transcriptional regulator